MHQTLHDSTKYKKFTQDRNQALEKILIHTQTDLSRMLFEALDKITGFVSHMAIQDQMSVNHLAYLSRQINQYLDYQFHSLIPELERRLIRMRKASYILTYISELEAVARATQKTKSMTSMDFKQKIRQQMSTPTLSGQSLDKRIWLALENLKHRIVKSFKSAIVRELSPKEIVDAVKSSYPKILAYKAPPRALKKVIESDRKKDDSEEDQEFDFYAGLTNDSDWDLAVQAYKDTELPPSRFDQEAATYDQEAGYFRYDWELEQEMTDDFVQQVRDGQIDAAQDLGVKDFVWVAVIDKKTCDECCLPRNGQTTSEIEQMLSTGELDKDECDATSPPAHPYCRCDIAPVSSTDEVQGANWKEFGDWLNS